MHCVHTALLGALLVGLTATPALAQPGAASPAGVQAFNAELQDVYTKLLPPLKIRAEAEARAQLANLGAQSSWIEVSVTGLRNIHLGIDSAPGMRRFTAQEIEVAVPRSGTWTISLEVDVAVRVKLIWSWVTIRIPPIVLTVDRISASVMAAFDTTAPDRPVLQRVAPPTVDFRIGLRSPNRIFDTVLRLLSPVADYLVHYLVADTLRDLQPQLAGLTGQFPGPIPGDGAPLLTDQGRSVPLGEICRNVDRKIRRDHVPHGTLLMAESDVDAFDSWEDAYRNGGPGNPGTIVPHGDGGDSAIFTGMYFASQVLRYAKTGESEALDNVGWMLQGVGNLLDVNGNTGLLARVAAPEHTIMGQKIVREGVYGRAQIRGQTWVGRQGGGGISRDQYIGVWFGLMLCHDLIPIPAVQAECSRRMQTMLDYYIAKDWYIDEDRPAFDGTPTGGFPTFYMGIAAQKLHYLLMGTRLDFNKYNAEFQRWAPLSGTHWFGAWTSSMNLDSYYKFNLGHLTYYNYFRLETDPGRWQDFARGFHIVRRYTAHHQNPHFNLIQADIDPSLVPWYHPAAFEAIKQFVTRNHRKVSPPVVNTTGITYTTFALPTFTIPGTTPAPATVTLPTEPLPISVRRPTGDFMWQRSPFGTPATPNAGNAKIEKNGLDLVLPYWMGRYHNAF